MALRADDLRPASSAIVGRRVECLVRVASTQDVVRARGREGAPEGLAVFAEEQTAGRGRQGRRWVSPPGAGLWFSVLLRPRLPADRLPGLALAAGVALARACRLAAGVAPGLKWPNDLMWGDRKLGGILAELVHDPGREPFVVLGCGLNVSLVAAAMPEVLRARVASLEEAGGRVVDRAALARQALGELDAVYRRWREGGFAALRGEWKSLAGFLGREVLVRGPGGCWAGEAVDVDEDGALVLATPDGPRRFLAGEVSLRLGPGTLEPPASITDNMICAGVLGTPAGIDAGTRAGQALPGPEESGKRITVRLSE